MDNSKSPKTIDEYIKAQPVSVQALLQKLRETIKRAAPDATETIKYGIPTFTLEGNLVHFGAFKTHIGFYPTPSGMEAFKKEFAAYKTAKGSVQFPLDQPLPFTLIQKIVVFRVRENKNRR